MSMKFLQSIFLGLIILSNGVFIEGRKTEEDTKVDVHISRTHSINFRKWRFNITREGMSGYADLFRKLKRKRSKLLTTLQSEQFIANAYLELKSNERLTFEIWLQEDAFDPEIPKKSLLARLEQGIDQNYCTSKNNKISGSYGPTGTRSKMIAINAWLPLAKNEAGDRWLRQYMNSKIKSQIREVDLKRHVHEARFKKFVVSDIVYWYLSIFATELLDSEKVKNESLQKLGETVSFVNLCNPRVNGTILSMQLCFAEWNDLGGFVGDKKKLETLKKDVEKMVEVANTRSQLKLRTADVTLSGRSISVTFKKGDPKSLKTLPATLQRLRGVDYLMSASLHDLIKNLRIKDGSK